MMQHDLDCDFVETHLAHRRRTVDGVTADVFPLVRTQLSGLVENVLFDAKHADVT